MTGTNDDAARELLERLSSGARDLLAELEFRAVRLDHVADDQMRALQAVGHFTHDEHLMQAGPGLREEFGAEGEAHLREILRAGGFAAGAGFDTSDRMAAMLPEFYGEQDTRNIEVSPQAFEALRRAAELENHARMEAAVAEHEREGGGVEGVEAEEAEQSPGLRGLIKDILGGILHRDDGRGR